MDEVTPVEAPYTPPPTQLDLLMDRVERLERRVRVMGVELATLRARKDDT